ncbi:MAG: protein kinase [Arachnia propionica]|uniref:protein kinase domain-containing protein n=1 Tax=Arachnia propionica TaxID=1750 RepID=UPI0026FFBE3A|nr:protein kinase [Arachnia propionica]
MSQFLAPGVPEVPGVRLTGLIGRGGHAIVYSGEQLSLRRPVAVKVDSRPIHDERNRRRFQREMDAASRISVHPNVVSLIDTGVLADDRPYLVMELCDGGSLGDLPEPLPALAATRLVLAVARALGAAHAAGVLHRDIKPGNILLDSYGMPRLSDFGIAAIQRDDSEATATLESLTPAYAPPEAFHHTEPTAAGDVWSLAAVLMRLITGRGPRTHADGRSLTMTEIIESLPRPLDLSDPRIAPPLRPVLARALDPDPRRRYRGGDEFASALSALLPEGTQAEVTVSRPITYEHPPTWQVPSPLPLRPQPETEPGGRSPWLAVGVAAALAVVVAMVWGTIHLVGGGPEEVPVAAQSPSARPLSPPTPTTGQTSPGPTISNGQAPSPAPTASPTAVSSPVPFPVNAEGLPETPDMPWPLGTCLLAALDAQEVSTATQVPCDQANWHIFAGGSIDPSIRAASASEAFGLDPNVPRICSDEYARLAGLDVSRPHDVRALGPTRDEWDAGHRGFSCAFVEQ